MSQDLDGFLKGLMKRRRRLPSQLAADLGISHSTVLRWLSGADLPSPQSCLRLAGYAGLPVDEVMAVAGHMPPVLRNGQSELPEFSEYARMKYPELDEELVSTIALVIQVSRNKAAPVLMNYSAHRSRAWRAAAGHSRIAG